MKTIQDIYESYSNGEYKPDSKLQADHVFDEDNSIKWNREQAIEHNKAIESLALKRKSDIRRLETKRNDDLVDASEYQFGLTSQQALLVQQYDYN